MGRRNIQSVLPWQLDLQISSELMTLGDANWGRGQFESTTFKLFK